MFDTFPERCPGVKGSGARIAIYGRRGQQCKRPSVRRTIDSRAFHLTHHSACHKPVAPEAEHFSA
eukprot:218421-Pyramimonas_sp.AAC.1